MSIWHDIENQIDNARRCKNYEKVLEECIDDPLREYFKDSKRGKIPIEYHTEAASKPVYKPLSLCRELVYINPEGLGGKSLKEYSFKWFGMTLDTLKKYVEDGRIIVLLDKKDKYNKKSRREIKEFFRKMEVKPIYVHIIEESLLSTIGYEKTFEKYLEQEKESEEIKNLEERWSNFWRKYTNGPIEMYGVKIDVNKVIGHYIRLKLLRDVFRKFEKKEYVNMADIINKQLEYLANTDNFNNAVEFAQSAYVSFNILGAPIYYCKSSGFVSVGSEVFWNIVQNNTKTMFGKIKEKIKRGIEVITMKNQKILYFEDIEESPHDIIKKHYYAVKVRNIEEAKECENKIIKMINEVYQRVEEKGDYIKAFESFMDEHKVIATLNKTSELLKNTSKFLSIPYTHSVYFIGYYNDYTIDNDYTIESIGYVISMLGFTGELIGSKPIKAIALKCVAKNKIFELEIKEEKFGEIGEKFGVEINKEDVPDIRIEIPKPYENIRYRVFRIPVKDEHHTSEEVTLAKLS